MATKQSADWGAIHTEFINGSMSLADLAHKYGVTKTAIEKRSSREKWSAKRQVLSAKVSEAANATITASRISELARFNEDDLKVARAIRAKAAGMMSRAEGAGEIRALASAFEAAQRIGRLALGATTENTGHSNPEGGAIPLTSVPPEEYLKAREQALKDFL